MTKEKAVALTRWQVRVNDGASVYFENVEAECIFVRDDGTLELYSFI